MVNTKDILELLNIIAPFEIAEAWDNSGLQAGNLNWEVKKIIIGLDVSVSLMNAAKQENCDLVLTHHPLMLQAEKFIDFNDGTNYIGEEAGKYIDSYFDMEDLKLKFEQLYIDVSDDFTLGYTIGKFTVRFKKDGKLKTITERYILVWKKYNGEWKIAINM